MSRPSLDEIGTKYRTDKASWCHGYLDVYERFFAPMRDEPITLLELGVQHGNSIRTWREYFSAAMIIGVDIEPVPAELRDWVYQCDQADPKLLGALEKYGLFDIIIDDCSHISVNTIASFKLLWPLVKPGGLYIIEDLACHDDHGALEFVKGLTEKWGFFGRAVIPSNMADLYAATPAEWEWIRLSRNLAIIGKSGV
jgi:hypothetical protein